MIKFFRGFRFADGDTMEFVLRKMLVFQSSDVNAGPFLTTKDVIDFTPNYSANVWFDLKKDDSEKVDLFFWVESELDIVVYGKLTNQNLSKTLEFDDELFPKKACHKFRLGNFSELFKLRLLKLELEANFKPKLVINAHHNRPLFSSWLYEEQALRDYKIICGSEEIKVHKNMLASGSPVFRSILQKEATSKKLVINGFKPATVQSAVRLIYVRKVNKMMEIKELLDLLRFVTKYNLKDKDLVENWVKLCLDLEKACVVVSTDLEDSFKWLVEMAQNLLAANIDKLPKLAGFELLKPEVFETILTLSKELKNS
uniref:BTB domain-containing protein n=1 Tax=Panagrolaimus sp. JU765 TaxID=591449 RepID=A0AC34QTQ1_9BILA